MAQKKFSELEASSVDGTSIFAQTKTEDGSLVSKSASSTSLAGYIGTSHQFAGLSTTAKNLVGAINEAAQSGGGASVVQLTQAEYTALSSAEKMNGSIYKITDNAKMYCLDKAYHPVEECTVAEYNQKTSAQQNDGTIYIQTDAETTGEDIKVSSTDIRTIDEGIADADGQVIDYSTWSAMTPQEQEAAGKVFVPDFPTATPNATEIPMSSSESTSVADKIDELENPTVIVGTFTADTNISLLRSTLIKVNSIKFLSLIFTVRGSGTMIGTMSKGFEALHNYDFTISNDNGTATRARIQNNKVFFSLEPAQGSYYALTIAYI